MKEIIVFLFALSCAFIPSAHSAAKKTVLVPGESSNVGAGYLNKVVAKSASYKKLSTLQIELAPKEKGGDENTFVYFPGSKCKNCEIEIEILSTLSATAPSYARGYVGIAFRISDKLDKFESVYLRPTNGRVKNPKRRAHAIQYFAYPDFHFDKLREIFPEKYESGADIGLNEWMRLKVVVNGVKADVFVNNAHVLNVPDLKLGAGVKGSVGLFVDTGTIAHFRNLKVTSLDKKP